MKGTDALSDILRTMRLRSVVYFRSDFPPSWGMEVRGQGPARFHIVVRGSCWVGSSVLDRSHLASAGDILLFPFGDDHWLAENENNERFSGEEITEAIWRNEKPFGGEGISTTMLCGHFEFNADFDSPLLSELPRMIHVRGSDREHLTWLASATNAIILETGSGRPGSDVVAERLAEVLFIQVLRSHIEQHNRNTGLLAALGDTYIAKALNLMHSRVSHPWTLEELAAETGMSRSSFAARFREVLGHTPMHYLTDWRMTRARQLLEETTFSMMEIAERTGYNSEAAFNRAFKRRFGKTPGTVRRSLNSSPATT